MRAVLFLSLVLGALPGQAKNRKSFDLTGHLKLFSITTFPYEHPLLPSEATGSSVADGRLKLLWRPIRKIRVELHPTLTLTQQALAIGPTAPTGVQTGVAQERQEALPLSYDLVDDSTVSLQARFDRASLRWDVKRLRLTLGRQPVSFGKGKLFTPLDLISPFRPTTMDTSYKAGVDALRADLFRGVSGRLSLVAAYLDDWSLDGTAVVFNGKGSFGDWELEAFAGGVYGDLVLGGSAFYNAGAVGYYGDLNLTVADNENFFRTVIGALYKPAPKTTLTAELYGQSLGASEPADYLLQRLGPRYERGELWLLAKVYAAVSGQYELSPLLHGGGALILNPLDFSVMLMPNLAWSAAQNASVSLGLMLGIGERPGLLSAKSEFGLVPNSAFLQGSFFF